MEEEIAGRIAFLDVQVQRKDSGFVTTVYRKPTHTGQYLDFASAHPVGHKRSVASALFTRAQRLCSSTQGRRAEEKKIREDLASNGYPRQIMKSQKHRSASPPSAPRKERKRAAIPYAVGVSETLSRIFSDYDVQICHVPTSKLRQQLVHAKDALSLERYPGVVYKIACQSCDAAYIGETGNFTRRLKEHKNDVANGRTQLNALAEHHKDTGHDIAWDTAKIIATEKVLSTRLLRESFHIQSTSHALNRTRGPLPTTYACALQRSTHV